jgi:hypothetical protein
MNDPSEAFLRDASRELAELMAEVSGEVVRHGPKRRTLDQQLLRHRLLLKAGGFEGIDAMTEVLDAAHPAVADSAELEEVDFDRDAALAPSASLANKRQDATVPNLDYFECLLGEICPPVPELLGERNQLRDALKLLGNVGVRPLVMTFVCDPGVKEWREILTGQLTPHECVEGGTNLFNGLDVLLRHRLLGQPGDFEGLIPGRASLRAPDSPVLQDERDIAPVVVRNAAPPRAAQVPNLRDERISLAADPLKLQPKVLPELAGPGDPVLDEVFAPVDLAFDASDRAAKLGFGMKEGLGGGQVARAKAAKASLVSSTFSSDIAHPVSLDGVLLLVQSSYSDSPAASSPSERS